MFDTVKRLGCAVCLGIFALTGDAAAMGGKLPEEGAPREWVRPGDILADGAAGETATDLPDAEAGASIFIDGEAFSPADLRWKSRVIAVFANTPQDPSFIRQLSMLERGEDALAAREVVVITDTDAAGDGVWRRFLRPDGFSLVLIDIDGTIMLRKPMPWDMREISRAIDRFPLRRQEIGRSGVLQ